MLTVVTMRAPDDIATPRFLEWVAVQPLHETKTSFWEARKYETAGYVYLALIFGVNEFSLRNLAGFESMITIPEEYLYRDADGKPLIMTVPVDEKFSLGFPHFGESTRRKLVEAMEELSKRVPAEALNLPFTLRKDLAKTLPKGYRWKLSTSKVAVNEDVWQVEMLLEQKTDGDWGPYFTPSPQPRTVKYQINGWAESLVQSLPQVLADKAEELANTYLKPHTEEGTALLKLNGLAIEGTAK